MNTHPYQVRTWLPDEPVLKYLGQAHWSEQCRCESQAKAERVARALSVVGYGPIMAVVKLSGEKPPEYVACYPDRKTIEKATGEKISHEQQRQP